MPMIIMGLLCIALTTFAQNEQGSSCRIRVLLEQKTVLEPVHWELKSSDGFKVIDMHDSSLSYETLNNLLLIDLKDNNLYIDHRKVRVNALTIIPKSGVCTFGDYTYSGNWRIIKHGQQAYLINIIDLEEYVFSVLRWESWPGWPLEVNRVFAIACRSYVMAKLMESRTKLSRKLYDIKATNIHQTYKGLHDFKEMWQAIEDTKGIILTHNGKPIIAMYDCCCGGIIPAHIYDINRHHAPYLARSYACNFCKKSKLFSWEIEYSLDKFEQIISEHKQQKIKIKDIKVAKRDKAGIVQEILITIPSRIIRITGKTLYALCKDIRSFCFSVEKKAGKIIISGKGYGHNRGLCQWGSRQMVREGWDYNNILKYYYPKTTFMKVQVNYSHHILDGF